MHRPPTVTKMASNLADDRRHGVRGELDAAIELEPVDRLDEPDRADLDESSIGSPRPAYRDASERTRGINSSISLSRAERSPSRRYASSRSRCSRWSATIIPSPGENIQLEPFEAFPVHGFAPSTRGSTSWRRRIGRCPRLEWAYEQEHAIVMYGDLEHELIARRAARDIRDGHCISSIRATGSQPRPDTAENERDDTLETPSRGTVRAIASITQPYLAVAGNAAWRRGSTTRRLPARPDASSCRSVVGFWIIIHVALRGVFPDAFDRNPAVTDRSL